MAPSTTPRQDTLRKAQDQIARDRDEAVHKARSAFDALKKEAEAVFKEVKKNGGDKQAKQEAERVFKDTVKQAEKARDALIQEAVKVFTAAWDKAAKA